MSDAVADDRAAGFFRTIAQSNAALSVGVKADNTDPSELHRATFGGNAQEYFGIWIVNTLLTIATLGVYAPWAKVRRNRYFYASTRILGQSFDYHATGGQLLMGWLLVAVYIVGYDFLSHIYPFAGLGVALLLAIVFPWLVNRALRFRARVTSYSNVRFRFEGSIGEAYLSLLLGGIMSLFSLGLLAPIGSRWYERYLFRGIHYGDKDFETRGKLSSLYKSMILPAVIMIVGVLPAFAIATYITMKELEIIPEIANYRGWLHVLIDTLFRYAAIIPFVLAYYFMVIIYRIGVRNVMWSAATYDGKHRLLSDIPRLRYAWILISNTVATLATLGLMRPWAAVRERRFLIAHIGIWISSAVEEVRESLGAAESAFSSEFLDSDGFDLGF